MFRHWGNNLTCKWNPTMLWIFVPCWTISEKILLFRKFSHRETWAPKCIDMQSMLRKVCWKNISLKPGKAATKLAHAAKKACKRCKKAFKGYKKLSKAAKGYSLARLKQGKESAKAIEQEAFFPCSCPFNFELWKPNWYTKSAKPFFFGSQVLG